jgi:hypothetical protein
MKTQINGVVVTPEMEEVLQKWYEFAESLPESYVNDLEEIQDFLCTLLDNCDLYPAVKSSLFSLIYIKNDLRKFIPRKGGRDE